MNIEIQDGAILRDGEPAGTLDAEGAFLPAAGLHHKTAEAIRKWLAQNLAQRTGGAVSDDPSREFSGDLGSDSAADSSAGSTGNSSPEATPAAAESDVPPAPAMDPRAGDKTPAYVTWLRTYYPAQAEAVYANRRVSAE